jgi:hypothetical protein
MRRRPRGARQFSTYRQTRRCCRDASAPFGEGGDTGAICPPGVVGPRRAPIIGGGGGGLGFGEARRPAPAARRWFRARTSRAPLPGRPRPGGARQARGRCRPAWRRSRSRRPIRRPRPPARNDGSIGCRAAIRRNNRRFLSRSRDSAQRRGGRSGDASQPGARCFKPASILALAHPPPLARLGRRAGRPVPDP